MDLFELNEAFAAQSLAVINELKLDKTKVTNFEVHITVWGTFNCEGVAMVS